jgi:hypothetical protein
MNIIEGFNSFNFNDNLFLDQQVHSISAVEVHALVHNRQCLLHLNIQTSFS